MSEQNWWQRMIAVINREYERRIRRASLVSEYGADHHHGPEHSHEVEASLVEHDEGELAEIVNVPKGTRIMRHTSAEPPPESQQPPS